MNDTEPEAPEAETDAGDRGGEYQGAWVRRAPTGPPHRCDMPMTYSDNVRGYVPHASAGDVWRCGCGRLWVCYTRRPSRNPRDMAEAGGVRTPIWRAAGLWVRLRYSQLWDRLPRETWFAVFFMLALAAVVGTLLALGVVPPAP